MRPVCRHSVAENLSDSRTGIGTDLSRLLLRGEDDQHRPCLDWRSCAACAEHDYAKASLNNKNTASHLSGFLQMNAATLPAPIDAVATEIMLTADDATAVHGFALAEK